MKASEENIDKQIKQILGDGGIEPVSSQNFTSQVMSSVNEVALKQSRVEHIRKQVLLGLLGILALGIASTSLFLLWQNGVIQPYLSQAITFVKSLSITLPFGISPWVVVGVLLHLMLFRVVMAFYLVNKHRKIKVGI